MCRICSMHGDKEECIQGFSGKTRKKVTIGKIWRQVGR
jgi:hypothetical protein